MASETDSTASFSSIEREIILTSIVNGAYVAILGREPDVSGGSAFLSALISGAITPGNMILELLNSPEFIHTLAWRPSVVCHILQQITVHIKDDFLLSSDILRMSERINAGEDFRVVFSEQRSSRNDKTDISNLELTQCSTLSLLTLIGISDKLSGATS
jgi:hypothetical protein